jgi:hypothetical protein
MRSAEVGSLRKREPRPTRRARPCPRRRQPQSGRAGMSDVAHLDPCLTDRGDDLDAPRIGRRSASPPFRPRGSTCPRGSEASGSEPRSACTMRTHEREGGTAEMQTSTRRLEQIEGLAKGSSPDDTGHACCRARGPDPAWSWPRPRRRGPVGRHAQRVLAHRSARGSGSRVRVAGHSAAASSSTFRAPGSDARLSPVPPCRRARPSRAPEGRPSRTPREAASGPALPDHDPGLVLVARDQSLVRRPGGETGASPSKGHRN